MNSHSTPSASGTRPSLLGSICCALLLLCAAGSCLTAQQVVRGPYLQKATANSIVVRWRTDQPSNSRVRYGNAPGLLSQQKIETPLVTEHEVEIPGLSPDTLYYYEVGTTSGGLAGDDAEHFFRTSPPAGSTQPRRFWVLGDSGTADSRAASVRDAYYGFNGETYTQALLMLGDNAYTDGTDAEYQDAVFDFYPTLLRQTAVWSTLGNHDGISASSDTQTGVYYDIFTLPKAGEAGGVASGTEAYYSFDIGNVHFVCLDSHDSDTDSGSPMMNWLENDLMATQQHWIVAFWHHPPYTKGSHDSDTSSGSIDIRAHAVGLLEDYGVDLVLSGHSHSYERSFLIDGHYGTSDTFASSMLIDGGDGRENGDGGYQGDGPGAVYIVAGSSGKSSSADLDHPVMYLSMAELGSVVIDVAGNKLDVTFLRETGDVDDYFTIVKGPPPNQPPLVDAGSDAAAIHPAGLSLSGAVEDETPEDISVTWSKVSGPGTVSFGNVHSAATSASFSSAGQYVLRLTADDGELTAFDDVHLVLYPPGTSNKAPTVHAGGDKTTPLSIALTLSATVVDDLLPNPPGELALQWGQISGPGVASFTDPQAAATTVSFDQVGAYVLRLTADDGQLVGFDDVNVTVDDAPVVVETRISDGDDDAEESVADGNISRTSSDLELIDDKGDEQVVGMRFTDVSVPRGVTITNAWIQFQVDEESSEPTSLVLTAHAADNAPAISSADGDLSSRVPTTSSVAWSPPVWHSVGDAGPGQRTPDLAPVLQQIINRSGWTSGNAMLILTTGSGERAAESHNGESNAAPLLHIEYVSSGTIFGDDLEEGSVDAWN
jgi:hypothetical protein